MLKSPFTATYRHMPLSSIELPPGHFQEDSRATFLTGQGTSALGLPNRQNIGKIGGQPVTFTN